MILDILRPFFWLRIVPRRILVCLPIDLERVVRRGAFPGTFGGQGGALQHRLVFDGGWGEVDVAFDCLVIVSFGDDSVGYACCCRHFGGRASGK